MKLVSDMCREKLFSMTETESVLCHYVMTPWGAKLLAEPVMSMGYKCAYCDSMRHYTCWFDPKSSDKKMMFCENAVCEAYNHVKTSRVMTTQPHQRRATEWALFCEMNGVGDTHHNVKFEMIEQSPGIVNYLTGFSKKPAGIVLMQGPSGSGKTYASMASCEYFTRVNPSCIFSTQDVMSKKWLERHPNYEHQIEHANLLVVDDFGTGEIPEKFMRFFLSLINNRIQWTDRGTIITTNLDDNRILDVCGEALSSRLQAGQKLTFKGEDRRKKPIS